MYNRFLPTKFEMKMKLNELISKAKVPLYVIKICKIVCMTKSLHFYIYLYFKDMGSDSKTCNISENKPFIE